MRDTSIGQQLAPKRLAFRGLLFAIAIAFAFAFSSIAQAQTAMQQINLNIQDRLKIDPELIAANGLRTIKGKHVTIYTDVPSKASIDELPKLFDAAVPQWCQYFGVDVEKAEPWNLQGFLIRDKKRFENAGLIPDSLPDFPAGINRGHEFWLYLQPDDYYTRHLILHEGTHAFMQWFGNGVGAAWYGEGMAELLALHRWKDGQLKMAHRISDATETEGWGRPKLIKQWVASNADGRKDKPLQDLLLIPGRSFSDVNNYAWCWAACEFLGTHPLSKDRFPELQKNVDRSVEEFNQAFLRLYAKELDLLERDWAWFIRELDYGYSAARGATSQLQQSEDGNYELKVDRSWQSLTVAVKSGEKFRVSATGRFQIGSSTVNDQAKPWPCQANGITIDWYRGRPLGELQAVVMPTGKNVAQLPLICQQKPISIGDSAEIVADRDGLLCFRVNESPANLEDNRGSLKLAIEKVD